MPSRVIVGTAGHIDHGKTSLVLALTGIDCDRWAEEKARGITIDLGFAHLREGDLQIGFVDVPGHERFLHNALAGMGGIRVMLLVVAADEGVKPQTREHLAVCSLLGIPAGLAGERTPLQWPGAALEELRRGVELATPGALAATTSLAARLTLLPDAPAPIEGYVPVRLHRYASEAVGRMRPLPSDGEKAAP